MKELKECLSHSISQFDLSSTLFSSWMGVVVVAVSMNVIYRPAVGAIKVGSGSQDWLALVWEVGHVGELMAVEFEDSPESLLIVPLAGEAVSNILHVQEEHVDLGFVVEGSSRVSSNLGLVLSNLLGVELEVCFSLGNSGSQLHHLESEGLDSDDLIGIDVNLLLIALLIREW